MKPLIRYLFWCAAAGTFWLFLVLQPVAIAETLEEAWQIALEYDFRLKASQESVSAAEERLKSATSVRMPELKAQAAYSQFNRTPEAEISLPRFPLMTSPLLKDDTVFSSELQLSLPLFTSGRISGGIDMARSTVEAYRQEAAKTAQEIKLQVAEAFIQVLRAQALVDVARSHVASLQAHQDDVRRMDREGLVSRNDVLAVGVALADARQSQLQAENGLDLARSAFNRLLGRPFAHPVQLEFPAGSFFANSAEPPADEESLRSEAIARRPELKALSHQADAYAAMAKSIRAEVLPQLAGSASWFHSDQMPLTDNDIWEAGVVLQWKIFDGGVVRHRAGAEERKRRIAEHQRQDVRSLIELQVRQAWLDVQESIERVSVCEKALVQAEENLKVAKNRYVQEIGTHTEVLDAETLRAKSLTNHVHALYDLMLARIKLRHAIGDLS
jgi:outer membrane protein TolC